MSLVQIAYQTLLTKLREWHKLQTKDQLELLQQASSLMGKTFREALSLLQDTPHRLAIFDYDLFYVLIIDTSKYLLFKSNSKARLNDCNCKSSWQRKVADHAPYMCIHQILLQLSFCIFPQKIAVEKIDTNGTTAQLAELLDFIP